MSDLGLNLFDVATTVDTLMAKQYVRYFQLQTAKNAESIQLTAHGTLQSLFSTFQQKMTAVKDAFNTIGNQADSSNSAVATAAVTGNDVGTGSHTVEVTTLARAQRTTSQTEFSSRTAALGFTKTLTFTNAGSQNFSIDVTSGDSLDKIRDKINNSAQNIGVTASIVSSTGSGGAMEYNLVLTAKEGTANQITISGDTGNSFGFTETVAAANAEFKVDGYSQIRSSNTVTDVLDGVTFNLSGTGTAEITVRANNVDVPAKTKTAITDMLAAYNQIITFLDGNRYVTSTNTEAKQSTTLYSDSYSMIKMRLQAAMNNTMSTTSDLKSLYDVGVVVSPEISVVDKYDPDRSSSSSGSLMIDTKVRSGYDGSVTYDWLAKNNFNELKDFFTNSTSGLFAQVNDVINQNILSSDDDGMLNGAMTNAQKHADEIDKQITAETSRLDIMKQGLIDQYSRLNGIISYYQNLSNALEKQYTYLSGMIKGK